VPKVILKKAPLLKDQIIDLHIDSMAYDNSALARYEDFVVFVDRGAPGDDLSCQITTLRPDYARAKILEIKKSDPDYRIEPKCKLFKVCGGCQWQHLPYEKQLEQKDLLVERFVAKLNLEKDVLKKIIGADDIWNYRNKVQFPVRTVQDTGRLKAGYFEWHSNELVNVKSCPIQVSLFDDIVQAVRELAQEYKITAYDAKSKKGWLRHICVRYGTNTGETLLTLVTRDEKLSGSQDFANKLMKQFPALVGVCLNINTGTTNVIYGPVTKVIKGRGYIFEEINGLRFKISATSFFQVNTKETQRLLTTIKNYADLSKNEIVLDAYCGGGLISLALAGNVKKVIGIEEAEESVHDAIFSAKENNIKNVLFTYGKVENKIEGILENEKPDVVVLDPPRIGCNKKVLQSILCRDAPSGRLVKKIIYVSCNPNTLVRDLEILCVGGFKIKLIQPVDMFPHTYHIESVVLLER